MDKAATETVMVYGVMAKVQGDLAKTGLAKDQKNQHQGFQFRGIDGVYGVLAPLLSEHGLCILPRVLSREETVRQTKSGGLLYDVVVDVEYTLACVEDGSCHVVRVFGEASDSGDKATNKALSAAYKYMAFQVFCIPVEGEDADSTTPEETVSPEQATKTDMRKEGEKLLEDLPDMKSTLGVDTWVKNYVDPMAGKWPEGWKDAFMVKVDAHKASLDDMREE